jgi:hypothetical protein
VFEFLNNLGVILGIPASIIAIVGGFIAARKWGIWTRLKDWLYKRSNRYRIAQLQERIERLEGAQGQQMEANRKELTQVDAATRDLTQRLVSLHLSSEHPDDLTTTEELRQQIKQLGEQLADLRKSVTEALWKALAIQTNNDRFLDNHASIVEFAAMLDQMAAQPAERESDVDTLRAQVADLIELQAKFLRGTMDYTPEAQRVLRAARDAKERANHAD